MGKKRTIENATIIIIKIMAAVLSMIKQRQSNWMGKKRTYFGEEKNNHHHRHQQH